MERKLGIKKRIALVAHDNKKDDLIQWAKTNKHILAKHELVATGSTGTKIQDAIDLPVEKLFSGPLGGDQQIGAMIAEKKLDILIFFWDPMETQPHDSDVKALLRIAVTWNVLTASSRSTADFIISSPYMDQEYSLMIPQYEGV